MESIIKNKKQRIIIFIVCFVASITGIIDFWFNFIQPSLKQMEFTYHHLMWGVGITGVMAISILLVYWKIKAYNRIISELQENSYDNYLKARLANCCLVEHDLTKIDEEIIGKWFTQEEWDYLLENSFQAVSLKGRKDKQI